MPLFRGIDGTSARTGTGVAPVVTTDPERPQAAPRESIPDDQAAGGEPMAEVPGGPQVDVPAAQGHLPDDENDDTGQDTH
jgi:hypothetical protein